MHCAVKTVGKIVNPERLLQNCVAKSFPVVYSTRVFLVCCALMLLLLGSSKLPS